MSRCWKGQSSLNCFGMSGIHLILIGVAAFGFLPLIIILYKKNRVKKILTKGVPAKATVYNVYAVPRQPTDIVHYSFYTQNTTQQFTGTLTIYHNSRRRKQWAICFCSPDNMKHCLRGRVVAYSNISCSRIHQQSPVVKRHAK